MRAIGPVLTLTWKDILLEMRSKDILISVVVFGIVVVVMFNFALNVDAMSADRLAPGILWVAFAFSGVLAMNRSYALEKDKGSLEGLLLCPVSGDELYFGKMLGIFLFMIIIQVILLTVFAILFNFSGFSASLGLAIVLATLGFASVGTLFAAISVQTRSREIMLPILFFPIILPVLVGAIEITSSAIAGEGIPGGGRWLPLLAIFDAMFLVLCPWIFRSVLEE